jgi:spermidine synthase
VVSRFEEVAWHDTVMGELLLRRRTDPVLAADVFEVKLGDEYLMSSAFTVGEVELARLGVTATDTAELDVVVAGLGLGYTAAAALADPRVRSLVVVEALSEVIDWHRRRLLPMSPMLMDDERCRVVAADFFAVVRSGVFPPDLDGHPVGAVDAVLVDIDHSPTRLLNAGHADFYTVAGLRRLAEWLRPGGVFALWSDDPSEQAFLDTAAEVFATVRSNVVSFDNPYTSGTSTNTVYVATDAVSAVSR